MFQGIGKGGKFTMPDRSVISNDISACSFPGPTILLLIKNAWVSFVLMYVVVKLVEVLFSFASNSVILHYPSQKQRGNKI